MSQMIHYRDDLFLLSVHIKALDATLALEADPEFWADRVQADLRFIDETVKKLAGILARNLHLVDRDDYLRLLERASLDFRAALERLDSGASPLAQALGPLQTQVRSLIAAHRDLAQDLGESLSGRDPSEGVDSSIVSGDELAKLLGGGS